MDITKRQNLLVLWKESFSVVRRSAFKLISVVIILGVLSIGLVLGAAFLMKDWLGSAASGGLIPMFLLAILSTFLVLFFSFYLMVCFWRVLGNTAENSLMSVPEVLKVSFVPAWYCIVGQMLWTLVMVPVVFALNFISNQWIQLLVQLALTFGVFIRVIYAFPAIALKEQGPIEGFAYSWRLTGKNYFDTVLVCVMNMLFPLLMFLFLGVCAYCLYVGIPLFFAESFDILHPTWHWAVVLGVIGCGVLFIAAAMFAFPIVVFVNRDFCSDMYGEDILLKQDAELRPLTGKESRQAKGMPEPLKIDKAPSPDLGPASVKLSGVPVRPQPKVQPKAQPKVQPKETTGEIELELDVLKATFRTEQQPQQVKKQLKEVYQPKKQEEGVIEYAEEDRMPTIVFDEQMTRQLEENRKFWQNDTKENTPEPPSEDTGKIHMSK